MDLPLRIVFMGTPDFAVPSLQALIDGPEQVVAVVCQPDRQRGRGKVLSPPPVKVLAERHGLPILQPDSVRTEVFLTQMRELAPDLVVVVAYGKILSESLLQLPRLGAINVHGSLLPQYRGAAPIQWAVINGEAETGVTIMQMDAGMDTGDILLIVPTPIGPQETAGELFDRLSQLGGAALVTAVEQLKQGQLPPRPQNHALASMAPMLRKEMGHLDWNLPAARLHCLIRGLDPWPSAYGFIDGTRYRFFSPEIVPVRPADPPGTLCRVDSQGLLIATGEDCLLLRDIQPEGKKRMPVAACLHGIRLQPGMVIT
ncbi:methionyl-tRNA formyltransferase [Desulfobulbus propionicus DSM 2032]|uniref:Methionyl-tRNA formyltransferase n=1 Tax=Desulfobulbus propionicus (strain ATCC 33891 / DSM 2032 / VKM B-1956 / 1pr3) TaxID=577650 RepID=A0A7U3YPW1_DESPD|nr:methionyl-tRNA formyltransferase [Desulfobulbus propionicus DSM 2032]